MPKSMMEYICRLPDAEKHYAVKLLKWIKRGRKGRAPIFGNIAAARGVEIVERLSRYEDGEESTKQR